jgi:hypothetical protein
LKIFFFPIWLGSILCGWSQMWQLHKTGKKKQWSACVQSPWQFGTRRSLRHRMGWKTSAASNSPVAGNECTATTVLSVIVPLTWDLKRGKLSRHQIFNITHQRESAFKPWCAWRDGVYYIVLTKLCQSLLPHLCWALSRQWDVFSF